MCAVGAAGWVHVETHPQVVASSPRAMQRTSQLPWGGRGTFELNKNKAEIKRAFALASLNGKAGTIGARFRPPGGILAPKRRQRPALAKITLIRLYLTAVYAQVCKALEVGGPYLTGEIS